MSKVIIMIKYGYEKHKIAILLLFRMKHKGVMEVYC